MISRSEILTMSMLSPVPQCVYHAATDSHLVYWRGVAMTRTHAMMIVHEKWLRSWSNFAMKDGAFQEFKRSYYLGAFGNVDWTFILESTSPSEYLKGLRNWMVKSDRTLFEKLTKEYHIREAMLWFADSNEELI